METQAVLYCGEEVEQNSYHPGLSIVTNHSN